MQTAIAGTAVWTSNGPSSDDAFMKALQLEVGGDSGDNECALARIKPNAWLGICWVVVCPPLLDAFDGVQSGFAPPICTSAQTRVRGTIHSKIGTVHPIQPGAAASESHPLPLAPAVSYMRNLM